MALKMDNDIVEEKHAKCLSCGISLMYVEHNLYGNRCVFCAKVRYGFRMIDFLRSCYYDLLIYREMVRIAELRGPEDGRMYLLAAVGSLGFIEPAEIKTVKDKKRLLKKLREAK